MPSAAEKIVARAENVVVQYRDLGVPPERVLVRIPGSWEGIQAAKALEEQGIQTHIILVYRFSLPFCMQCTIGASMMKRMHDVQYHCDPCSHVLYLMRSAVMIHMYSMTHFYSRISCRDDRCCCSFAQAVAAAQAGVSVLQPNLGLLGDWYRQHPGAIRDPKVPDEHAHNMYALPLHASPCLASSISCHQLGRQARHCQSFFGAEAESHMSPT